jgi:hypothetical protein
MRTPSRMLTTSLFHNIYLNNPNAIMSKRPHHEPSQCRLKQTEEKTQLPRLL